MILWGRRCCWWWIELEIRYSRELQILNSMPQSHWKSVTIYQSHFIIKFTSPVALQNPKKKMYFNKLGDPRRNSMNIRTFSCISTWVSSYLIIQHSRHFRKHSLLFHLWVDICFKKNTHTSQSINYYLFPIYNTPPSLRISVLLPKMLTQS